MGDGTVEFGDEALISPEGIYLHPANDCVDLWHRQSGGLAELEKPVLEHTHCSSEVGEMLVDGAPDGQ